MASPAPRRRPGPVGAMSDADLVEAIRQVLADSPFHGEGYRKVWARLRHAGLRTSKERVRRLMRENGLRARQKRRFKRTTDSHHAFPIAPNLLEQDFSAERPNQKWNADISEILSGNSRLLSQRRNP